ncbi:MAG TPA: hypothetical protein DCP63_15910 [Bacteroidetes bacterium]|nr:hypothetical protein [Bacteroidota bacterium]
MSYPMTTSTSQRISFLCRFLSPSSHSLPPASPSCKLIISLVLLMAVISGARSQTPFSQDSAAAYLRTIAVEIGPRPMGSPNEQRAMEFALTKFREFGISEPYILEMNRAGGTSGQGVKNTRSGTAVGVLKGTGDRIIVIGGHMDSSGPEIPGANDDGSGSAVVIELARILSQRKNESTIVFALFGGEEQGLRGSRHFVEHFEHINRVALMLQVDMANGSDWLVPTIEAKHKSSPEWLVQASYEELEKLGHTGLYFPTHFFALMSAVPGGGVGSDHQPFMEKDIPAIDFTSDFRDPIHTPQDSYENFNLAGLKRSGDLVYRLVERFDSGVPEEKSGQYYLLQFGSMLFFIPLWLFLGFIAIALGIAIVAMVRVRRRRPMPEEGGKRASIPGLKLFLLMLIIQSFVWLSENVVSLIKGIRYPWLANLDGYFLLGLLAGCIGLWIGLQLAPKLRLRTDSYSYYVRAVIFLLFFLIGCAILSVKLALYPAMALFFLGLAMLVRRPALKLAFWILSPHFMYRLFFSEGFDFLARAGHASPEIGLGWSIVLHLLYILFFSLWSFPFLLGFAAVRLDVQKGFTWLTMFRTRWGVIASGGAFILCIVFLLTQPSFSEHWRQLITVEQSFDLDSLDGTVTVKSPEYLDGARIQFGRIDTILGRTCSATLGAVRDSGDPWLKVERSIETVESDSSTSVSLLLRVSTTHRPYTLRVGFSTEKNSLFDADSPLGIVKSDGRAYLSWYSFPDTSLLIPLSLIIRRGARLDELVEATFVQEAATVRLEKEGSSVIRRTHLSKETHLDLKQ